jgi:hypothetical protein
VAQQQRAQRRLAAILAADVVGYSKPMGGDEEGTVVHLRGHRKAMVDQIVSILPKYRFESCKQPNSVSAIASLSARTSNPPGPQCANAPRSGTLGRRLVGPGGGHGVSKLPFRAV